MSGLVHKTEIRRAKLIQTGSYCDNEAAIMLFVLLFSKFGLFLHVPAINRHQSSVPGIKPGSSCNVSENVSSNRKTNVFVTLSVVQLHGSYRKLNHYTVKSFNHKPLSSNDWMIGRSEITIDSRRQMWVPNSFIKRSFSCRSSNSKSDL